ncbi:MAG: DUF4406 domain-containing protein [Lachnospiraceae bacterium]|nr:DUF4406 domain-containing protein [Lachnospiraceae bacterium]
MFGKYTVVHLGGTTRGNYDKFRHVEEELTKMGYIVFKPVFYDLDEYNKYKDIVDDQCYEKLKMCDIFCIVTPKHIGSSTMLRSKQAAELGKKIYYWSDFYENHFREINFGFIHNNKIKIYEKESKEMGNVLTFMISKELRDLLKEDYGYEGTGEYYVKDVVTCESRTPDDDHKEPFKYPFIVKPIGNGGMMLPNIMLWTGNAFMDSGITIEDINK